MPLKYSNNVAANTEQPSVAAVKDRMCSNTAADVGLITSVRPPQTGPHTALHFAATAVSRDTHTTHT